jgi:hypothetical protein
MTKWAMRGVEPSLGSRQLLILERCGAGRRWVLQDWYEQTENYSPQNTDQGGTGNGVPLLSI